MSEQINAKQVLSTGQVTFLFLMFVSMLFVIFAVGVYIGRWSQPTVDRKTESLKTTNIRFVEPNLNSKAAVVGQPDTSLGAQQQPLQGTPLTIPVDETKNAIGCAVQVAAVTTIDEANGLLTQLRRDGLTRSYIRSPEPGSVIQLYSVEVGPYDDKVIAERVVTQLKSEGLGHSRVSPI